MNNKYQIVCCLHGDEPLPLYGAVIARADAIIGNPRALVAKKRFLDKDLNSCFGEKGKSHEHQRATELLELLSPEKIVLDFHTFSCTSEPFCIVVDPKLIPLARSTGIKHIIVMRFNIKNGHALINHRSGISIEVGEHSDPKSVETTSEVLKNLEVGTRRHDSVIYESIGILDEPCAYPNLEVTPEGWIPLLAGERAYAHHGIKVVPIPV